jgi:uracil-DNA glycosylase family 4
MPGRPDKTLPKQLTERLHYYQELGINLFFKDRLMSARAGKEAAPAVGSAAAAVRAVPAQTPSKRPAAVTFARPGAAAAKTAPLAEPLPVAPGLTLFEAAERVENDSLEMIREEIGDCKRCRLCEQRNTIVFGDGNPRAELMFVGEGPGRDEDAQGLPFVGRAGKLLTQMIEAMGLERKDVYIANVVKCRPPENRTPEKDEIAICSPFLLRQIDVIRPKVLVCLGGVAAQTLLETNRSVSHFRGQWLDFRGARLMATYHPAYLLRNPNAKGDVWKDLQKVMAVLGLAGRKGRLA